MRTADGYIISKCLNGDKAAFGLLVDKYKEGVYALAYSKLGNFHDAEDVAQEVFIKAYRKLHTLKHYDSFHAWLYATTSNLCKDWIRARARRPDGEYIEDEDPKTLEVLSIEDYREKAAQRSLHESLEEALESLPEMHRQVLTLYYLAGMSGKEMARFLGIAPMTAWRRLSRARAQLKKEMAAMMDTAFEGKRLPGGFTLRIVEAIKRMKIQPIPRTTGLPWGISVAAGIIITVLSLNPNVNLTNSSDASAGSPLPLEAKVLKTGEIPVDVLDISHIPFISSRQRVGDGGDSAGSSAFFLAPRGEGDTWTKIADMPTARFGLATGAVDGKIYAIGGCLNDASLTTVEEYDPATNAWTKKASMPTARMVLSASVVNGKIHAFGGCWPLLPTVEEYNPVTDTWTKKADMPIPISNMSTSVVRGKIYLIGGRNWRTRESYSTIYEYDPTTDTYTKKANMPTARAQLSTAVVNGKIYAFGGCDEPTERFFDVLEVYDPATNLWVGKKGAMPVPNCNFGIGVVNGKIHLIGGMAGTWQQLMILSRVDIYDPITNTWTKGDPMLTPRCSPGTSVVDGKIYVLGGWDLSGKDHSVAEEYTPEGWPFSISFRGKLPAKWGEIK